MYNCIFAVVSSDIDCFSLQSHNFGQPLRHFLLYKPSQNPDPLVLGQEGSKKRQGALKRWRFGVSLTKYTTYLPYHHPTKEIKPKIRPDTLRKNTVCFDHIAGPLSHTWVFSSLGHLLLLTSSCWCAPSACGPHRTPFSKIHDPDIKWLIFLSANMQFNMHKC